SDLGVSRLFSDIEAMVGDTNTREVVATFDSTFGYPLSIELHCRPDITDCGTTILSRNLKVIPSLAVDDAVPMAGDGLPSGRATGSPLVSGDPLQAQSCRLRLLRRLLGGNLLDLAPAVPDDDRNSNGEQRQQSPELVDCVLRPPAGADERPHHVLNEQII